MPRFAANLTMMFNEVEFLERFSSAASAGFECVEILFPYEIPAVEIKKRLDDNGLENVIINLAPGDWEAGERGLAALPGRECDFQNALDQALEYTDKLETQFLHIMSGIADVADKNAAKVFESNLNFAAERVGGHNTTLLIEPINQRGMPGYFLSDFNLAADIVRRLDQPNLRLQYDIFHRQIIHGDVVVGLRSMMPIIGHIQIAGVPDRHEPSSGELDYPFIFKEIDDLGYGGWIGCEYMPAGDTVQGLAWVRPWL